MTADDAERLQSLSTWGIASYVLHLIVAVGALLPGGQASPALLVVALLLDVAKREDATGTWHASHIRWRMRTVLVAAVLYLVTLPLWLLVVLPGWLAWLIVSAWFFYRIVRGLLNMSRRLPMELAS